MTPIEEYYNKFNEDKRLLSRHGQVEYTVTMHYIHEILECIKAERGIDASEISLIDIGAGTGRYSVALSSEGYDVTAVELVKYNLGILKKKGSDVKAFQGNATKLKRFEDESFDVALLMGPMYHLISEEDKLKALSEAKRVVKKGGFIFVAYCMNEYSILSYGFKEGHIKELIEDGRIDEDFRVRPKENELYDYVRLEEIHALAKKAGLVRKKIFSPEGACDHMRDVINSLDEESFKLFIKYQLSVCERPELMGAGSHVVDLLKKQEESL